MKKFKIFLALFTVTMILACNKTNYENELLLVLSDKSTSGFFISIDVNCEKETFPIVINNSSLYNILFKRKVVKSQEEYSDMISQKIIKKDALQFDAEDNEMLKGYSIIMDDSLEIYLKMAPKKIINEYFGNERFKSEVFTFDQEKEIIYCLFKNRIYCRRDCVSGYVFITPLSNKVEKHNQ